MSGACFKQQLAFEEAQTAWFTSHGGECLAVRIGASNFGRGLFATRCIREGEPLVKVPDRLMLTANSLPEEVRRRLITQHDWCPLTLLILAEQHKGEASVWAPYIACLPSPDEHHSTIFWDKDELKYFGCTRVLRGTMERREMISEEFESVKKVLDSFPHAFGENVSLFQFAHAYATVVSRAWHGPLKNEITLRPFLDFCNHNPDSHAAVAQEDGATFLVAERDYSEGEEVFISYGRRPNAFLAVDYGFVIPNNPCDQAELWMEIPWNDPIREQKLDLLKRFNMPTLETADGSESGELPVILEEVIDPRDWEDSVGLPQARAFARIICLDSTDDMLDMIEESEALNAPVAFLPRRDQTKESRAMGFLLKMIKDNIHAHKQALQDLYHSSMHLFRREMGIAVLNGELRVLQSAERWLNSSMHVPKNILWLAGNK